jgi:hypothetical protein
LLAAFALLFAFKTIPSAFSTLQTDFPNYYLTAKLVTEGADTAHVYEWRWLARQKDHHEIDRAVVGLVPITPFSTLIVTPLTGFKPLLAKRVWLVFQLALLIPIGFGLHAITGQPMRRIALIVLACMPLHRNLSYGQFYILLVALLIGACLAHQRRRMKLAGALVGIAAAIKIFPIIFCVYFLRKREWRACLSAVFTGAACVAVSVGVFGWEVHRTYVRQVLPWTLRGDVLSPFTLSSGSLSTLLHCLFLYEPQWNPHPWHFSPVMYAVLQALLPMLVLAPALLLCDERDHGASRVALEWSGLTVATLAVSTIPASYNFTLMILPMTVLVAALVQKRSRFVWLAVALYVGIGSLSRWNVGTFAGLQMMLSLHRFYMLLAFVITLYAALGTIALRSADRRRTTLAIAVALAVITVLQAVSGVRHQRGLYDDFAYRLPDASGALLAAAPALHNGNVLRIAMQSDGYRLLDRMDSAPLKGPYAESSLGPDEIAFASAGDRVLIERAGAQSVITAREGKVFSDIIGAESPTLSADGKHLAYLRVDHGRGVLFVRFLEAPSMPEQAITPASLNVEQATFMQDGSLIVAAMMPGTNGSRLLEIRVNQKPELLPLGEARYPAASPDGRWLAFSRMRRGNWNLALLDLQSGSVSGITDAECNTTEPAWEPDSKTILYSSDCGRALWFTAVSRRRVVP